MFQINFASVMREKTCWVADDGTLWGNPLDCKDWEKTSKFLIHLLGLFDDFYDIKEGDVLTDEQSVARFILLAFLGPKKYDKRFCENYLACARVIRVYINLLPKLSPAPK